MKELFLLRGLPGSGKSTLAKVLGGIHIEADQYFMDVDGVYKFDPSKLGLAHEYCQHRAKEWMDPDGIYRFSMPQICTDRVVVSNTFTQDWEMKPYVDMAAEYGYRVYCLIVENRHGGENTHQVPESTINKMRSRFDVKL